MCRWTPRYGLEPWVRTLRNQCTVRYTVWDDLEELRSQPPPSNTIMAPTRSVIPCGQPQARALRSESHLTGTPRCVVITWFMRLRGVRMIAHSVCHQWCLFQIGGVGSADHQFVFQEWGHASVRWQPTAIGSYSTGYHTEKLNYHRLLAYTQARLATTRKSGGSLSRTRRRSTVTIPSSALNFTPSSGFSLSSTPT